MNRSTPSRVWWPAAAVVLLHLGAAFWCIRHGAPNPDEGFYAAAARAVWEGSLPYRDFGYTQPPLLPYLNGLVMQLTGFGLFEQRAVNGVWAALTLVITARLVARRSSVLTAAGAVLLFSLSAPWMYFIHLGKTYALTSLLVTVAAWIWLERPPGWRKAAGIVLLGVIGTGCRLPAAPFFALLALAAVLEPGPDHRGIRMLISAATIALAAAVLLVPFLWAAPDAAMFWVIDFHRISVPLKSWHLAWQEVFTLAPALWLAAGIGFVAWLLGRSRPQKSSSSGELLSRSELVLGGAATVTLLCNLLPGGVYEEYAVPFLAPLAIPVGLALYRLARDRDPRLGFAFVASIAAFHFAAAPAVLWHDFPARRLSLSQWLTPNAPAFNPALPAQLAAARHIVETVVPAGTPIVGPNLILALETGRPVPPTLIMGPFSFNTTLPPADARHLNLATPADYEAWLADPGIPLLAFFPQPQLNYGWTVPTFERLPESLVRRWVQLYRRDFVIIHQEGNFLLLARPSSLQAGPTLP